MSLAALAFAAGAAALQLQAALPALGWALVVPLLLLVGLRYRAALIAAACAAGFFWAAACAQWRMSDWLASDLEGRDIAVVGVVSALPALMERGVRFELDVESAEGEQRLPGKVLISWYRNAGDEDAAPGAMVHAGERWAFTVRLRRPHGLVNPHGFDYEAWLLERGIGATGYVRARPEPRRLGERKSFLDLVERAREAVRDRFNAVRGASWHSRSARSYSSIRGRRSRRDCGFLSAPCSSSSTLPSAGTSLAPRSRNGRASSGPSPSAWRRRRCCFSDRSRSPDRSPMPWRFRSSRW